MSFFDATEEDYEWAKSELVRGYATSLGVIDDSKGYKSLIQTANATIKKDSSQRRTWVASIDGDTAGIVTATMSRKTSLVVSPKVIESHRYVLVENLVADPEYRGRGVATRLVERCENWAEENGISNVHIETYKELPGTMELYTACGYTRQENESKSVKAYGTRLTEELWTKKLGA